MISKENLFSLLKTHGNSLNEALSPLMAEVEAIMISQPLAVELPSDGNGLNPISLSTLLTMKNRVRMPPPEESGRTDKREERREEGWRRIQHLSEEVWTRWQKKCLVTLSS